MGGSGWVSLPGAAGRLLFFIKGEQKAPGKCGETGAGVSLVNVAWQVIPVTRLAGCGLGWSSCLGRLLLIRYNAAAWVRIEPTAISAHCLLYCFSICLFYPIIRLNHSFTKNGWLGVTISQSEVQGLCSILMPLSFRRLVLWQSIGSQTSLMTTFLLSLFSIDAVQTHVLPTRHDN